MGALEDVGQGVAEEAVAYLGDIDKAFSVGAGVVSAAIAAELGTRDLLGGTVPEGTEESFLGMASKVGQIVGRGLGLLSDMVDAGIITEVDLSGVIAPGTLLLASSDGVSGEGTQKQAQASIEDTETSAAVPEAEENRELQERLLVDIFGEDRSEVIEGLTPKEMKEIGKLVEEIYLRVPIGTRGKATQPERAQQFKEYISGTDLGKMAEQYDITTNGIQANLRKAIEIMHRAKPKTELASILDGAVAQLRKGR